MEFEIDFGEVTSGPTQPSGPLYASVDGRVANLNAGECVFVAADTSKRHVMTHDVLKAMDATRRFATLDEHIGTIESAIPQLAGRRDDIRRVCDFLIQRGLLVSADEMLARANADVSTFDDRPDLVIRTCDRPDSLQTLLGSLPDAMLGRLWVMDDSRTAGNIEKNRAVVADHAPGGRLLDRAWRQRLAEYMSEQTGADLDQAEGLFGPASGFSPGAAWNAATLLTAGRRVMFLDDDWVWNPRVLKSREPKLGLDANQYSTMRLALGDDWQEELLEATGDDWFATISATLGGGPGNLMEAMGNEPVSQDDIRGKTWNGLDGVLRQTQVLSVCAGCYGDSTADTSLWFYLLDPEHAGNFATAPADVYHRFLARPRFVRGFDRTQIARMSPYTPTGYDNRSMMPPAAPSGRGEDLTFAALTRYIHPMSLTAHIPLLLEHTRPEAHPPVYPSAFTPQSSRFLAEFALGHAAECAAEAPGDRLIHLGSRLRDLALASEDSRLKTLHEFNAYLRSQTVNQLQRTLQGHERHTEHYGLDAKDWLEANAKPLLGNDPPRLEPWPENAGDAECARRFARDLNEFAAHLESWPGYWNCARGRQEELAGL